jgi:hypothetical protein
MATRHQLLVNDTSVQWLDIFIHLSVSPGLFCTYAVGDLFIACWPFHPHPCLVGTF